MGLLVLVLLLAGLVLLWVQAPALYGTSDQAKIAASNTRAGLLTLGAALIAATAAGTAVWINHRALAETQRANREAQQANREALAETQRANREEDQRERYSTAIGQLESNHPSVQLGALYTLERIADYSERDQRTVVEVLSAFVRQERSGSTSKKIPADGRQPSIDEEPGDSEGAPQLPTVVQAALTVLGRLPAREGLPRADLARADLSRASLVGANLSGAGLGGANLSGAHLLRANLSGAWLVRANLSRADLDGANLSSAWLGEASLSRADLRRANLSNADLRWANLSCANLGWANLSDDYGEAYLVGAYLAGADLRDARNLLQGQLDSARGDAETTTLPYGLRRPASWSG